MDPNWLSAAPLRVHFPFHDDNEGYPDTDILSYIIHGTGGSLFFDNTKRLWTVRICAMFTDTASLHKY